jgi:hypothetical protein
MTTGVSLAGLGEERNGEQGQKQTAVDPGGGIVRGVGRTPLDHGCGPGTGGMKEMKGTPRRSERLNQSASGSKAV